jgi:uncharacterized spore protein YtfJ
MTDEHDTVSPRDVADRTEQMLMGVFGEASPRTVFSAPHTHGDDLIITAAAWERAGGFGFGAGGGGDDEGSGSGGGGGGGGTSQGRPVAIIRIGPGGLEVRPVIDFTRIGVTVLLSALGVWRILRR